MSTSGSAAAKPSQRSNSTSRSSRRATLAIGPGGALPGRSAGSVSPQRALRTRVLREKGNEGSGGHSSNDVGSAGKAKAATKAVSQGPTRTQQMQFAFGSKVMKPKTGTAGAAGEIRNRMAHVTAVVDTGNVAARSRRERAVRHDSHEQQRAPARGRGAVPAWQQPPPAAVPTREETYATSLKAQVQEREATIADLQKQLENKTAADAENASDGKSEEASRSSANQSKFDGGYNAAVDEGARAALKAVEEESRAEVEDALVKVETVAAAGLSRTEEMQASVDEIIRILKAGRQ